jgi:putative tryptophan/tyrosine transport system substrate-binding protein
MSKGKKKHSGQQAMNRSKEAGMGKKTIVILLLGLTLASFHLAEAQQAGKIARIGFLGATSAYSVPERMEAFRQGLRDLGYIEGKSIVIEWRYADGKIDRLPALAAELVRLKVDVIVTQGSTSTRVAQEATRALPIVMTVSADPVAEGIIASLARPGGNVTGLTTLAPELGGKRLELLREAVPKASRVGVLFNPANTGSAPKWREIEVAGQSLGLKLQHLEVRAPEDFEKAFKAAKEEGAHALMVFREAVITTHRDRIVNLAAENKLPAMYELGDFVEAGGLMSYSPNEAWNFRRAAVYVDKILKGTKPADLPVEQPTKFEFIINLKTAKQIGLTIPPNVLARADRVIK